MTGVRYREEGWEGQCFYCREWWPLDLSCWQPKNGLRRCRACWREYSRGKEAGRRAIDSIREMKLSRGRLAYRLNREERLAYNRRWKAANRERVAEYNRRYRAGKKAAA